MVMLYLVFIMYLLVASTSSRVLYAILHLEGALLGGILLMTLWVEGSEHPWWLLLMLIMSAVSGSIGLALIVSASRKSTLDQIRA